MNPVKKMAIVIAVIASGCTAPPAGLPIPNACPYIVGNGAFEYSLPCDAVEQPSQTPTPGLTYEKSYQTPDGIYYVFEVVANGSSGTNGDGGVTVGDQGNLRLDGQFRSSFGDQMVLATLRLDGLDVRRAIARLADGSTLRVSIFPTTSLIDFRLKLSSLSLIGTDGSDLITQSPTGTVLIAPISTDSLAALSDGTIWDLNYADTFAYQSWKNGDYVGSMPASAFGYDAFLVKYPDFASVGVDYVDEGTAATVSSGTIGTTCTTINLSNGQSWTACTDKSVLDTMLIGEAVLVFRQFGVDFIMRLSNGRTALVIP